MSESVFRELGDVVTDVTESTEQERKEGGSEVEEQEEEEDNIINAMHGEVTIIESMCMNCQRNGETKLLFTSIPYFREIIISSFDCEFCNYSNNEVQFGGEIREKGVKYVFTVQTPEDLNRQIIKSESATLKIPQLQFEIPEKTQKGSINTIEGVLLQAAKDLGALQAERIAHNPEVGAKVAAFLLDLTAYASGEILPFTLELEDPAGNSFVENPHAPERDPALQITWFERTSAQNEALGLQADQQAPSSQGLGTFRDDKDMRSLLDHILEMKEGEVDEERNFAKREALILPSSCHHCLSEGNMISCLIDIPHFKEVLIMAFNCDSCGFRSSEIKPGGTIPTRGTQITFTVETTDDFAREVLKSDFCHLTIPEISLELDYGSLGSMFTTVEGLLSKMLFTLKEGHPFFLGDSATQHHAEHSAEDDNARKFADFVANFESLVQGELLPFTVIMRDPMGNSFVSPPYGQTPEEDGQVVYEDYDRTAEEEDFMGLTGMHVGGEHEEGGEGGEEQVVVQSDRLAFPHDHGLDHPTPFTAGQMLSTDTVEGEVLAPDRANRQQQEQQEEQEEQG